MKADSECLIRSAGTGSWGKDWMGVSRAEGQEEEGSRQKKTDAQKPRQEVTHLVQGTRTRPGGWSTEQGGQSETKPGQERVQEGDQATLQSVGIIPREPGSPWQDFRAGKARQR